MSQRLGIGDFKRAMHKGLAIPADAVLHKAAGLSIRIEQEGAASGRRKLFTITTEAIDRDNDTIALDGWELANYLKNPVVLWGHQSYAPPIGRSLELTMDGKAMKAVVEFVPADMPIVGETAEMVFRMCDMGFLNACSVGFRPLEFKIAKDRMDDDDWWPPMDFTRQELCEWSICTIPSNPEAVIDGRSIEAEAAKHDGAADAAAQQAAEAEAAAIKRAAEIAEQRRMLRAAAYS